MSTNESAALVGKHQDGGGTWTRRGAESVSYCSTEPRPMQTGSPVFVGAVVVGNVSGGVFTKTARGSRHMLRSPRGWALDLQSLRDAEGAGAVTVEIVDVESGITYSAPCSRIHLLGFHLNRGHGEQIALLLRYWQQLPPAGSYQQAALFAPTVTA